jgi:hypothetical protein
MLFPPSQRNRPIRVLVQVSKTRRAKREVDPCQYLAEAQVGVASTGGLSLLGHLKQLPASAPAPALAATAGKLHRPTPQHVLIEGPAAKPGLPRNSLHRRVVWWGAGIGGSGWTPLAEAHKVPPRREAFGEPLWSGIAADHERRRGWPKVPCAVLASDLYSVRVAW